MEKRPKTYLDWAATSWPKPASVYDAVNTYARNIGIDHNRGHFREALEAEVWFNRARGALADLMNAPSPERIVFFSGATEALNTAIQGSLSEGDHVICSSFEHNAVARPLRFLEKHRGIQLTQVPGSVEEPLDPGAVRKAIRKNTRMVVLNHISNVFGSVLPVCEVGKVLSEYDDILFVVDGAQSLGSHPVDVRAMHADIFTFPGHKSLLGPPGTGGFYLRDGLEEVVSPIKFGGTGVKSSMEIVVEELPHKYEVGTLNSWGIAGLAAGTEYVLARGVEDISAQLAQLTNRLVEGLKGNPLVRLYAPSPEIHHGVVSFNFSNMPSEDAAALLDRSYNIKLRAGLHCSPDAHNSSGTLRQGTVRASVGCLSTTAEVDYLIQALQEMREDYVESV